MTIKDVLIQIGKDLKCSQDTIDKATNFADAMSGQGEDVRRQVERELTEEESTIWRVYGLSILSKCLKDKEFRKEFLEKADKRVERN